MQICLDMRLSHLQQVSKSKQSETSGIQSSTAIWMHLKKMKPEIPTPMYRLDSLLSRGNSWQFLAALKFASQVRGIFSICIVFERASVRTRHIQSFYMQYMQYMQYRHHDLWKKNGPQKSPNSKVNTFDTWNTQSMPEVIDNFKIDRNGAKQKTSTGKVKNRTKSLLHCLVSCRCPGALAPLYRPAKQYLKTFLWTKLQRPCREQSFHLLPCISISFHLLSLYTSWKRCSQKRFVSSAPTER